MTQPNSIALLLANEHAEETKLTTLRMRGFYPGCRVESVYSAEELLDWAGKQEWSAIIVDEQLLLQNGMDQLTELRRRAPHAAIIVQAEKSESSVADQVVWAGADSYLYKHSPAFLTELPIVVRAVVESRGLHSRLDLAEERLYRLTEHMTDMVYELDAEGRFLFISPSVVPLLGYSPDELLGSHFSKILHSDDLLTERRMNEVGSGAKATRNLELRLVTKEGLVRQVKVMEVKLSGAGPHAKQGKTRGTLGVVRELGSSSTGGSREPMQRLLEQLRQEQTQKATFQQQLEQMEHLNVDRAQMQSRMTRLEEQLRQEQVQKQTLQVQAEQLRQDAAQARERLQRAEEQLRQEQAQKQTLQFQVEQQRQEWSLAQERVKRAEEQLRQEQANKQTSNQLVEQLRQDAAQAKERVQRLEELLRLEQGQKHTYQQQLEQHRQDLIQAQDRLHRQEEQLRQEQLHKPSYQHELEQFRHEAVQARDRLLRLDEQLRQEQSQKQTLQFQADQYRQESVQARDRLLRMEEQLRQMQSYPSINPQELDKYRQEALQSRERLLHLEEQKRHEEAQKQSYEQQLELQRQQLAQAQERFQQLEEQFRQEEGQRQDLQRRIEHQRLEEVERQTYLNLLEEQRRELDQAQGSIKHLEDQLLQERGKPEESDLQEIIRRLEDQLQQERAQSYDRLKRMQERLLEEQGKKQAYWERLKELQGHRSGAEGQDPSLTLKASLHKERVEDSLPPDKSPDDAGLETTDPLRPERGR